MNAQEIMLQMPGYDEAVASLNEHMNNICHNRNKNEEFNNLMAEYDRLMNSPEIDSTALLLVTMSIEALTSNHYDPTVDIAGMQEKLIGPIHNKLMTTIKEIAIENGYTYVFDTSNEILLPAPAGDDITALVKQKLGVK